MLSLYQSSVNYRSRKGRATLGTQSITVGIFALHWCYTP